MDKTLVLYKPDLYETDLEAAMMDELQQMGMTITEHFVVKFPPDGIFYLWPGIFGRRWITNLMKTMTERPLDVYVIEGKNAVEETIKFKDNLRERSAKMNSHRNLIHSSDSSEAFLREYHYLKTITIH